MTYSTRLFCLLSLLLAAALFGFFYAWVCSTMWGLDAADPRIAIAAMQAMNASVRNAVFAPAFFGTPVVLLITAGLLAHNRQRSAARWFSAAALLVISLSFILTMGVNVPMNEALGTVKVPKDLAEAQVIWDAYSPTWQVWNQIRTGATGLAVLCVGIGLSRLNFSAASVIRP